MSKRRRASVIVVALLVSLNLLSIAVMPIRALPRPWEYVTIGWILGTLFGTAAIAAAWTAIGPLRLRARLPLSLLWIVLSLVALAINAVVHMDRMGEAFVIVMGVCLLGQWAVAQVPWWGFALGYGLRLQHVDEPNSVVNPVPRQFGIRQLMIATAIVAILLVLGRHIGTRLVAHHFMDRNAMIFAFLAVASSIMSIPLVLSLLLPRYAVPASAVVLLFLWLGTEYELPLLKAVTQGPGPDTWHLYAINGFQAIWVLAVISLIRLSGYGLSVPKTA